MKVASLACLLILRSSIELFTLADDSVDKELSRSKSEMQRAQQEKSQALQDMKEGRAQSADAMTKEEAARSAQERAQHEKAAADTDMENVNKEIADAASG